MSIERILRSCGEHEDDYVAVMAADLAAALEEAGEKCSEGSLLEFVSTAISRHQRRSKKAEKDGLMLYLHRKHHLASILAVHDPSVESPQGSDLRT